MIDESTLKGPVINDTAIASGELFPDEDQVNHPSHYGSFDPSLHIECIDAMRAAFGDEAVAAFCKLNAFKYIWRESSKQGNVSIKKAIWYLNKYLELNKE